MKSSKKYISEYICLKILNGEYKTGDLIYSENKLAIKFNCSRLTARSSLSLLVNAGILTSYKGKGYIVSENALNVIFYAKKLYDLGNNHKFGEADNETLSAFKLNKDHYALYYVRTYSNDKLISISYIAINKKILNNYFEHDYDFQENPIMKIIEMGFVASGLQTSFEIINDSFLNTEDINLLGYNKGIIPIVKQKMLDEEMNKIFIIYSIPLNQENIFNIETTLFIN